jgi:2-desacetyl-2-hydroxyethyl bacteriochlorophyllide A dehydrogenase
MKSAVLMSPAKGKVQLQEVEVADPAPGELQVRVHASLVSPGTERAFIMNMPNTPGKYPMEPGYCAAGVVEKVGAGVSGFSPGDRVAAFLLGHRQVGNVPAQSAARIPDGVPFEKAAFLALGQIALQGVRKMRVELGERGLVLGLGIIGQLALQALRLSGAVPAIGVDTVESRRKAALACGADQVLDSEPAGWMAAAAEPKIVIESTGAPEAVGLAFQVAGRFGRVSLLASTRGDSTVNFYRDVHRKGLTIIGAHASLTVADRESRAGYWTWGDDAACFLRLLESRKLVLEPLISTVVEWRKAEELYGRILGGDRDLIGSVLRWA